MQAVRVLPPRHAPTTKPPGCALLRVCASTDKSLDPAARQKHDATARCQRPGCCRATVRLGRKIRQRPAGRGRDAKAAHCTCCAEGMRHCPIPDNPPARNLAPFRTFRFTTMTTRLALALAAALLLAGAGRTNAQCYKADQSVNVRRRHGAGAGVWRPKCVSGWVGGKTRPERGTSAGVAAGASAASGGARPPPCLQPCPCPLPITQIRTAADICSASKGSLAAGDIVSGAVRGRLVSRSALSNKFMCSGGQFWGCAAPPAVQRLPITAAEGVFPRRASPPPWPLLLAQVQTQGAAQQVCYNWLQVQVVSGALNGGQGYADQARGGEQARQSVPCLRPPAAPPPPPLPPPHPCR